MTAELIARRTGARYGGIEIRRKVVGNGRRTDYPAFLGVRRRVGGSERREKELREEERAKYVCSDGHVIALCGELVAWDEENAGVVEEDVDV